MTFLELKNILGTLTESQLNNPVHIDVSLVKIDKDNDFPLVSIMHIGANDFSPLLVFEGN